MNSIRTTALVATSALVLSGMLALAPSANADVGVITVAQKNASGQTLCRQIYDVGNLTQPLMINDPVCSGVTSASIFNGTLEPITASAGGPPEVIRGLTGGLVSVTTSILAIVTHSVE
ncbi:hypothetical protein ACFZB9_19235 [Kitasatospora sp. NPDC008050]|uniref:hypothetical protein n=1 Tax=Kitasatospora sp. NPDC008050 TaxID=3364021 RepID=UPI0036E9412C